ncbi:Type IV secretion system protein VirB4 [Candidatus Fokinia solitaria]|uniref:Type IV secretion system protein VirB4 n=1 Tax=Candidatus Fokinia solitaria TaxID=1802984 RepID=A0A2U8BRN5_9RICK|nr:hypothetical protein [Candidatus Fokinia solitaria]AWD32930.1 Type IV secretion system protein VirB4 [Candidatus Fokinia solitaria]
MQNKAFNTIKESKLEELYSIIGQISDEIILTKEGELVQAISIEESSPFEQGETDLKTRVHSMLHSLELEYKKNIAIYIYLVRDYKDLIQLVYKNAGTVLPTTISKNCQFDHALWNSLHIVVVHKGIRNVFSTNKLVNRAKLLLYKKTVTEEFERQYKQFSEIMSKLTEAISIYKPKKLQLKQYNNYQESELMTFLNYLLTSQHVPHYLEHNDALYDSRARISDHLDYIVIESDIFQKRYISTLNFKYPYPLHKEHINTILEIDTNFIICERLIFPEQYQEYSAFLTNLQNLYKITQSTKMMEISSINQTIDEIRDKGGCCMIQITIIAYGENKEELQDKLTKIHTKLASLGVTTLKEDLYNISNFLSSFPGNSQYLHRANFSPVSNSILLGSIISQKVGNYNGTKFGVPLAILKNIKTQQPFFFDILSHDKVKHTVIVKSPTAISDSNLKNLIKEYIANNKINSLFLRFTDKPHVNNNVSHLQMVELIKRYFQGDYLESVISLIFQNMDLYEIDSQDDTIKQIHTALSNTTQEQELRKLFDNASENTKKCYLKLLEYYSLIKDITEQIKSGNIAILEMPQSLLSETATIGFIFLYITLSELCNVYEKNTTPKAIYISELSPLLAHPFAEEMVKALLKKMLLCNLFIIGDLNNKEAIYRSTHNKNPILKSFRTRILIGDAHFPKKYKQSLGLTNEAIEEVRNMSKIQDSVLIIQDDVLTFSTINSGK